MYVLLEQLHNVGIILLIQNYSESLFRHLVTSFPHGNHTKVFAKSLCCLIAILFQKALSNFNTYENSHVNKVD